MARTTTDEALPFKFLVILAVILALWSLLRLLWLLLLAITAGSTLVSKAYRCQGSGCPTATGSSQVALVHQYSAAKQHLPSHKNSKYCRTIMPSLLLRGESWGRVLTPSLS